MTLWPHWATSSEFPAWMWRNTDVVDFVTWLRLYNDSCASATAQARFYGLIFTASEPLWKRW